MLFFSVTLGKPVPSGFPLPHFFVMRVLARFMLLCNCQSTLTFFFSASIHPSPSHYSPHVREGTKHSEAKAPTLVEPANQTVTYPDMSLIQEGKCAELRKHPIRRTAVSGFPSAAVSLGHAQQGLIAW